MTVLDRNTATGLGPRSKQVMVGLAMAVVGVGAAFGISQLTESDAGAGTAHEILAERSARVQALDEAALLEQRMNTGLVQQQMVIADATARAAAGEWALEDELNALRRENVISQTQAPVTSDWSIEQELAAIRGRTGANQGAASTTANNAQQPSGPR